MRLRVYKRWVGRCFVCDIINIRFLKEEEESHGAGDSGSGLGVGQLVLALTRFIHFYCSLLARLFHLFHKDEVLSFVS